PSVPFVPAPPPPLLSFPTRRSSDLTVFGPRFVSGSATVQAEETFATALGQRSSVMLSDGSLVTLNTDSQARVVYSTNERRIMLRSEEHTSELQSRENLVCRLLLEKK